MSGLPGVDQSRQPKPVVTDVPSGGFSNISNDDKMASKYGSNYVKKIRHAATPVNI